MVKDLLVGDNFLLAEFHNNGESNVVMLRSLISSTFACWGFLFTLFQLSQVFFIYWVFFCQTVSSVVLLLANWKNTDILEIFDSFRVVETIYKYIKKLSGATDLYSFDKIRVKWWLCSKF